MDEQPDDGIVLRWICQACGWSTVVAMPGFAGDGYRHYPNGEHGCGPLMAVREPGFLRGRAQAEAARHA